MRTTLDIADDVLQAAKELARREHKTTGRVLSELARRALCGSGPGDAGAADEPDEVFGFRPFPSSGGIVTNELINQLRDQDIVRAAFALRRPRRPSTTRSRSGAPLEEAGQSS